MICEGWENINETQHYHRQDAAGVRNISKIYFGSPKKMAVTS